MKKLVNLGNHNQKSLVECNDLGIPADIRNDPPPPYCSPNQEKGFDTEQNEGPDGWLEDVSSQKVGLGKHQLCDPMQTGQIVNDVENPQRNTIYRYSKGIRGCDEAVMDLFRNIVVLDEDGKAWPVPIIWATQERAVTMILQDNVRKDNSLVVDRIKLPHMAIYQTDLQFNQDRYIYHKATDWLRGFRDDRKPGFTQNEKFERDTVFGIARGITVDVSYLMTAWTLYSEDMNQIREQILLKFSPVAYIRVRGVQWENIVSFDSEANNIEIEPGDQVLRVIKYQFNFTAKTFIPQPITRRKAVLKTKIDIFDGVDPEEITEVIDRLEETVEEFKC